jgi:adenosylmethionine-8-amino-7-oxononanoate aminotransferase
MAAAIELESDPAAPGRRGYDIIQHAFWDENLVVRVSGDTIALSPPLIASEPDLGDMVERIRRVLQKMLLKSACGVVDSGVPDLGSNPSHLAGFGRNNRYR